MGGQKRILRREETPDTTARARDAARIRLGLHDMAWLTQERVHTAGVCGDMGEAPCAHLANVLHVDEVDLVLAVA